VPDSWREPFRVLATQIGLVIVDIDEAVVHARILVLDIAKQAA
jgi:hypothetical protein